MMNRRRFALIAAAALVLPMLAVEKSSAQFFGRFGRNAGVSVSVGYPYGYGYGYSPYYGGYYSGYAYSPWSSGYYSPWYGSSYYTTPTYRYTSPAYTYAYPMTYGGSYVTTTGTPPAYATGTNTTQAFYPPNAQGNMPATLNVQVPADAQVWFDGESTSQGGMDRTFRSPPLEQGQNYSYEVKARWNENGKDIERTRKVRIHAGERVNVNFMANEEGLGAPKQSGSEGTETQPRPKSGSEGTETSPLPKSGSEGKETPPRSPGSGS